MNDKKEKELALKRIELIENISGSLTGFLEKEKVFELILSKLVIDLGYSFSAIWTLENSFLRVAKAFASPTLMKLMNIGVGNNIYEVRLNLDDKEDRQNFAIKSLQEKKILTSDKFLDFTYPAIKRISANTIQRVIGIKLLKAIPITIHNEAIGILIVAAKDVALIEKDIVTLQTFANQISIAIYNARLFSQTQAQIKTLKERAEDLESLLNISSVAIGKLKSANALQGILDAAPKEFGYLGYVGGCFFSYDKEKKDFKIEAVTDGKVLEKIKSIVKVDFLSKRSPLVKDADNLFNQVITNRQLAKFSKISDFVATPGVPKKIIDRMQKALNVKSGLLLPVTLRDELQGVLLMANSQEKEKITKRDEGVLNTFVNNLSLAFENVKLDARIKKQIEDLKEANERLLLLDEAKTSFVSIASHQFRTPVAGIKGYLSMLVEGDFGELTEKQRRVVELNLANIERLVKMIDLFLDITKIEAGRMVLEEDECNLEEIINEVIAGFKTQLAVKKELKIIFEKPKKTKESSKIYCDNERIRHVFVNLIDNAIKYTPAGEIRVSLEVLPDKEIIKVKDTGVGINEKEAGRLFEKFVRAEGGYRLNANGSGLGLYIVKKITEGHGGKVTVESKGEGRGTTFIVELPKGKGKEKAVKK